VNKEYDRVLMQFCFAVLCESSAAFAAKIANRKVREVRRKVPQRKAVSKPKLLQHPIFGTDAPSQNQVR
jgi:hypothetical protein